MLDVKKLVNEKARQRRLCDHKYEVGEQQSEYPSTFTVRVSSDVRCEIESIVELSK